MGKEGKIFSVIAYYSRPTSFNPSNYRWYRIFLGQISKFQQLSHMLTALAQMVACLPMVQQVRGSIPGGVVNFNLKIFNLEARRGGDVHFLIARL